jgi:tetratricopeptide (TPR) repeat protein
MARPPAKSLFVLLALGVWILACPASLAEDDPNALSQQVYQLMNKENIRRRFPLGKARLNWQSAFGVRSSPETADALNNLGFLFKKIGDYASAEPLSREVLRIRQKVLGPEHSDTATSLNNLAVLYQDVGEYAKAEPLYREALRIDEKVLGSEHPGIATDLNTWRAAPRHQPAG